MGIGAQYIGGTGARIKANSRLAARRAVVSLLAALGAAGSARAEGFDYYVLALSWSPSWCAGARGPAPEQCAPDRDLGFTLHGLWPQYDAGGWPQDCVTQARDPARGTTRAMADIMGSPGLAWYQWQKHGRCAGSSADDYFTRARRAYDAITLPEIGPGSETAAAIEQAFRSANAGLAPDDLIVTCAAGRVQEVRICLTPALAPRACASDVLADACRGTRPLEVPPVP